MKYHQHVASYQVAICTCRIGEILNIKYVATSACLYVIRPQTRTAAAPVYMQHGCLTKHDIVFVLLDLSSALLFRSENQWAKLYGLPYMGETCIMLIYSFMTRDNFYHWLTSQFIKK